MRHAHLSWEESAYHVCGYRNDYQASLWYLWTLSRPPAVSGTVYNYPTIEDVADSQEADLGVDLAVLGRQQQGQQPPRSPSANVAQYLPGSVPTARLLLVEAVDLWADL